MCWNSNCMKLNYLIPCPQKVTIYNYSIKSVQNDKPGLDVWQWLHTRCSGHRTCFCAWSSGRIHRGGVGTSKKFQVRSGCYSDQCYHSRRHVKLVGIFSTALSLYHRKWWEAAHQQKKVPSETKIKSKLRQVELPAGFPNIAVSEAYLKPVIDDSEEPFSWAKPDILLLTEYPFLIVTVIRYVHKTLLPDNGWVSFQNTIYCPQVLLHVQRHSNTVQSTLTQGYLLLEV